MITKFNELTVIETLSSQSKKSASTARLLSLATLVKATCKNRCLKVVLGNVLWLLIGIFLQHLINVP